MRAGHTVDTHVKGPEPAPTPSHPRPPPPPHPLHSGMSHIVNLSCAAAAPGSGKGQEGKEGGKSRQFRQSAAAPGRLQ